MGTPLRIEFFIEMKNQRSFLRRIVFCKDKRIVLFWLKKSMVFYYKGKNEPHFIHGMASL